MSISRPQKEGARSELTAEGYTETVTYNVTQTGGNSETILYEILQAGGLPRIGDPHPVAPNTEVLAVTAAPWSTEKYRINVRYGQPTEELARDQDERYGPVEWSGAIRLISEETKRDANGDLMRVFYGGTPQFELTSANTGEVFIGSNIVGYVTGTRFATAEVDRSLLQLTARRLEREDPMQKAIGFHSAVNADRWLNMPSRHVLFDGMSYEPDDDDGWRCEYTFTYNPRGWSVENSIKINGQTPIDATVGNGIALHDVYTAMPFSRLELV